MLPCPKVCFGSSSFVSKLWRCGIGLLLALSVSPVVADDPIRISVDDIDRRAAHTRLYRTPAMFGDFYFGSTPTFSTTNTVDRLFVLANDLDVPLTLPGSTSTLSLSEAGPIGIFHSSSLTSIQQLQSLLRSSSPIGSPTLVGTINDAAQLTTADNIGSIQSQIAATPAAYDIILLAAPPGSYAAGVTAVFVARNGGGGQAILDSTASGAIVQGGVDSFVGGEDLDAFYFFDYVVNVDTRLADATSGGVGRMKIAEGGTVLPQDRIYCRYSYADAVRYADGVGLSRFVPGFERSFLSGLFSMELRLPIAAQTTGTETLFHQGAFSSDGQSRFGNMAVYGKSLLLSTDRLALSGGLGVVLPTAGDLEASFGDGTPLLVVSNESLRLQPFLAGLFAPTENCFVQGFVQFDGAANGNSVAINAAGNGLQHAGVLTDSSNLFFDMGVGYWLYRSQGAQGLTGVIPMIEVHQNLSLQDGDNLAIGSYRIGDLNGTHSLTSLVAGTTFEMNRRSNLSLAYVTAVGGGAERQYNGGLQVFFSTGF